MAASGCASALSELPPPGRVPAPSERPAALFDADVVALFLKAQLILATDPPNLGVDDRGRAAVDLLNQALALHPKSGTLWRYLAEAYAKVPDHREAVVAALQAISLDPQDARAHFVAGQQLRILGKPDEAEPHLEAAATLGMGAGRDRYLSHYYLYLLRQEQGRTDAAAQALEAWSVAEPEERSPHQLRARLLWDARRYDEGFAAAVQTLRRAPDDRDTREIVAEYHQYDPLDEIAVYEEILTNDWVVPELHDAIRRVYDRVGRFDRALEHLGWVLVLGTHDGVTLTKRSGWLQYRMHEFEGVRATVAELRELHPDLADDPELHELLAAVLTKESRYTEALSQLAKIPAPGPLTPSSTAAEKAAHSTYVRAVNRRVDLHLDWGRADLAVEAAVSARQVLDPRMRTDHVRLLRSALRAQLAGQDPVGARETLVVLQRFGVGIDEEIDILFAEENSTDGIAALKEACLAAPDRMTLLRRYAIELLRFEGIETALATVQNAEHRVNALLDRRKRGLDASGEYAVTGRTALLHSDLDAIRAALHQEAGDVTAAVASLRDALAHRARDPYTLNHLAYLFAEEGIELPEAESLILRALEQQPFSGVMQDTYGWVLYRSGRHEEALVALEAAVRYAPREPEILAHLGEVLARLGQRDAARARYEEALEAVKQTEPVHRKVATSVAEALRALDAPAQANPHEQGEEKRR